MTCTRIDFNVEALEPVTLQGPSAIAERDLMSPYVWTEPDGRLGIMVRAVPPQGADRTDTGMIWAGWSNDGRVFDMEPAPAIVPGPDAIDCGGVEDPTVVRTDQGFIVYYTGVCADFSRGEMLYATGPDVRTLTKQGVALASTKTMGNTKEATVDQTADGQWRLFYEYATHDASRVGLAFGDGAAGPWTEQPTPFLPRKDSWDNWHLSTGPLLTSDPDFPVMFYNGATHDARWRIGWVAFDRHLHHVVDRGLQPLITPPPVEDRTATDIAFAASVIVRDGGTWLYYSLEDRRLARALIRRS
jgi:predicted GH43/DUF377 family glycosyl hydrolase